ncbi:MAG: thiamine pyrophosphate-binding protein [Deltaproteobacteria bacterium]|nr:MAG: thiamine pyrophosphate-binding protein [Deltaproteobacteria bacterium]TMQ14724.1 MAG: thiamine pyrophosphate-binding protein [Deltaproteobacteria bacterium]
MNVAEAVGRGLVAHGVGHVFGVVGSGNFHVTNAMIAAGARFVAAAHEGGAASMADGYARVSGRLAALSVHQGPGITNALTGIVEAAKSRTPLVVLAPEAASPRSNFFIDLPGIAAAIGAGYRRVSADRVASDVAEVCRSALDGAGQTVVLGLPLDVQAQPAGDRPSATDDDVAVVPVPAAIDALVDALVAARRPVFIAGRGATRAAAAARTELSALAERTGALLAVSAAARGLFAGDPWYLDVSGGFATPLTAELIPQADLVVAWGSTLNMWTTRHGRLIAAGTAVAQVDLNPAAIGINRKVDIAVCGEVTAVARACSAEFARRGAPASRGWRSPELGARIAAEGRWRAVPFRDETGGGRIDPRTLSIALDDLLPAERTVVIDSGNFMGYPSMFLGVPDAAGFCFTQAYQSIGLGLASALGAAIARPDRLTVAALGDGGFLMSVAELTTAVRLGVPLVIVVYNDAAYGAEVHHFGPDGHPLGTVTFPDEDLAAIGRGFGCAGVTVRAPGDLAAVKDWLARRDRPIVVDAKVVSSHASWWLEEAFRGH